MPTKNFRKRAFDDDDEGEAKTDEVEQERRLAIFFELYPHQGIPLIILDFLSLGSVSISHFLCKEKYHRFVSLGLVWL